MFKVFSYSHYDFKSFIVATNQIACGGCKTAEESARIMPCVAEFKSQDEAISFARKSLKDSIPYWHEVTEYDAERAPSTSRTHDGSPALFTIVGQW